MPTPQEVLVDPNFHALPSGEQLKVMRTLDPNFAGLPPKEQGLVVAKAHLKFLGQGTGANQNPPDKGFFSTLGSDIKGMGEAAAPKGIADYALGPVGTFAKNTAGGILQSHIDTAKQAYSDLKEGNVGQGTIKAVESLIPVFGPMANQISREIQNEQYGQASAHLLELVGTDAARAVKIAKAPAVRTAAKATGGAVSGAAKAMGKLRTYGGGLVGVEVGKHIGAIAGHSETGATIGGIVGAAPEIYKSAKEGLIKALKKANGVEDAPPRKPVKPPPIKNWHTAGEGDPKPGKPVPPPPVTFKSHEPPAPKPAPPVKFRSEPKTEPKPAPPVKFKEPEPEAPRKVYPAPAVKFRQGPVTEEAASAKTEAPTEAPAAGGRAPRPTDEYYKVHAQVKKAIRSANDLHKQGVTVEQLKSLSPEERTKALGKNSEETFNRILFELRGLETGKVKPEPEMAPQPSQPQQAKPASPPTSKPAQRVLDTVTRLEKEMPDYPITVKRLREELPNLTDAQLKQAIQELQQARKVRGHTSDVTNDPNAIDGIMALNTR
jgi:hypothetical protein